MAQSTPTPQLLTYQQAADRIAVSKRHVQRLVASGQVPFVKIGSAIRIPAPALAAYITANTHLGKTP